MVSSATIALERSFWQKESKRKASVTLQPTSSDEQVGDEFTDCLIAVAYGMHHKPEPFLKVACLQMLRTISGENLRHWATKPPIRRLPCP